jgi:hypothetical protein
VSSVEYTLTDDAIAATGGHVRLWPNGDIVSTEFSASNGPRTAGGAFPAADDPWDDVAANPNHRWTRIIDADLVMAKYGLSTADGVRSEPDPTVAYDGMWDNRVAFGNGSTRSNWDFRNDFGLPSPGFQVIPIRRDLTNAGTFAFIGDSVGTGFALEATSEFQVLTEGVFTAPMYDAVSGRRTQGGSQPDGVAVAKQVPDGTELVVVELGYNDDPAAMATRIDALMTELRARHVGLVAWVNLSERRSVPSYAVTNSALATAKAKWSELVVLDWNAASSDTTADRWFADGVHLTSTGDAELSLWLRDHMIDLLQGGYAPPRRLIPGQPLRIPVVGVGGVPESGVSGVALNVTAVLPSARGHMTVWPCGLDRPGTSSVNYVAGGVSPNAVVVPVDASGEVCVWTLAETDVVVDVSAWFGDSAALGVASYRLVDSRVGVGPIPPR